MPGLELRTFGITEEDPLAAAQRWDMIRYQAEDVSTKTNRAGMACGLEVRVLPLDQGLVDDAFSLTGALRFRDARSNVSLKRLLRKRLPNGLTGLLKQCFRVPVSRWMRKDLRDWADRGR